ncbi:pyridoxal phosphate-dependent aminotransferase [Granulicella mallensis]|uniref:Aminotransferase n=1 Tax=Granulicella mallensis (strain ATCC BAA-1857 / DSM 23137 / MP5ACTX8) TaxID=682795 RepID=G8NSA7_GRAMM|nr:threonine-phosphate decarboxylase [Granulicella mallensis]AEU37401.1 aminotransferase class I and II [Granulicella mallensis MP5ACTX8]
MTYPLHGGQLRQIAERFGIAPSQLLDFSANINPAGPPPAVLSTLRTSLDDLSTLTDYPDLQELELKQSISQYSGVAPENIAVANGFVSLLEAALRTLKIRRCLLPVPGFVEYRRTLERAGVEVCLHELNTQSKFSYDPAALTAGQHDAILLANPQNPSGVCHSAETLQTLVTRAAETNTYVFLDEAFIDYVPEHSLTTAVDRFANLIVFRSVTKFHGIPGLRVAYAVSNHELASSLSESLPPWPITTLASRAVSAALGDQPYAVRSRAENAERRTTLQNDLEQLGLLVYPSAANFLLFRLPATIDPDRFWQHMIVAHQIVLRACANYEALPAGHFRVGVRTQEENARLSTAISKSLSYFAGTR